MSRVYNFSAGPAVLPEEVLQEAADEMLDYRGCGMSVMEMSHRSGTYQKIIDEAEADLRQLMGIPDNYKVLFLQGGASQQFAMIPMNLMKNRVADYIITGQWAKKAWKEASIYGKANAVASSEDQTFSYIPDCSDLPIDPDADYVYICENNTIYGTKFKTLPNTKGKPLVADVSSCFLSEPVDVTKYGMIYGGVQKNIGPAGVVIAIIREDLITEDVLPGTPTMLKYKIHADAKSLYNTPPAYGIYICGKVFKWLQKRGIGLTDLGGVNSLALPSPDARRVVLVGFGPTGRILKRILNDNGVEVIIVEMNIDTVTAIREQGGDIVYGDASQREILRHAGIEYAESLILSASIPDAKEIVGVALELNPHIDVMIHTKYMRDVDVLKEAGASQVFSSESEVALSMAEYFLREGGADDEQIVSERQRIRAELDREVPGASAAGH